MLKKLCGILILCIAACFIYIVVHIDDISKKYFYPINYEEYVTEFASQNDIDEYLIYAIIKTESSFNEYAESDVGARGLMQIMDDAYDWVKFRMNDDRDISYNDMFDAKYNIEYGTYLVKLLYEEYGDIETTVAAYHTGRGNVNNWLKDKQYSVDGKTLSNIPSKVTEHYVDKVMSAYNGYNNLYKN